MPTQHALPGTPVVYLDMGHGPAVVIVHGLNAFAHDWTAVAEDLASQGLRVLVPYRRGRPPSGPLGPGYTLADEVADVSALLDVAGPGAALVGHSYGGLVALLTAAERADLGALLLYEPPVPTKVVTPNPALGKIAAALRTGDSETAIATIITDIDGNPPSRVDEVRAGRHWVPLVALAETALGELSAMEALALAGGVDLTRYGNVATPTTVLVGERTEPTFGAGVRQICAAMPVARMIVMPGQGHLAHVESPTRLAELIVAAAGSPAGPR